jgi:hypothetical protein
MQRFRGIAVPTCAAQKMAPLLRCRCICPTEDSDDRDRLRHSDNCNARKESQ